MDSVSMVLENKKTELGVRNKNKGNKNVDKV